MFIGREDLEGLLGAINGVEYAEIRYQSKITRRFVMTSGELEEAIASENSGVAVRLIISGNWGFSSTSDISADGIRTAIGQARSVARARSGTPGDGKAELSEAEFAVGDFSPEVKDPVSKHTLEEKIGVVRESGKTAASVDSRIKSVRSYYAETEERKAIVNTDGASCTVKTSKPEFMVLCTAVEGDRTIRTMKGHGITGGWSDLREKAPFDGIARESAEKAIQLLSAKRPKGEKATVILDPAMTGLLSHEAVGHTVEADFVLSGSITSGKIGKRVGSEILSMSDSGTSRITPFGAGTIFVDDEGVLAGETEIIRDGILVSYLHDRETAAKFGVTSTGNARAYEYTDEPLVRMRNTYVKPGSQTREEMISDVRHGYLVMGPQNGQADANGEFMFGAEECLRIENGEIAETLRGATISGRIFDALMSVDAVSRDFSFGIGTGYCGKFQAAKVDGGGPFVRLQAYVGGVQDGS